MRVTGTSISNARLVLVGRGRLGTALAKAFGNTGTAVVGPLVRGDRVDQFVADDVVLLTVPDDAIASVAASIPVGPVVGHCSGALTLDVLGAHDGFSVHPLLSVTDTGTQFEGAACAIAARSQIGLTAALWIAKQLHMEPIEVPDAARSLYHAAASVASNYLVTLEDAAEQLASATGIERRHLARLAQSALDNWTQLGGPGALTGPIARGDEATVRRQRDAVAESVPQALALWDAMAAATRALATRKTAAVAQ